MKKTIRVIALLLALLLSLPLLSCAGCARDESPAVMEYEGLRLTEGVYRYWLSCYRAQFAHLESTEPAARLHEIADTNIRKSLIAAALFDGMGLRLDTLARNQINAAMESMVADAGSRESFDETAASFGTSYEAIRSAITYEQKAQALYQYLFGENGQYTIAEEDVEAYYQANYRRVRVLTVLYITYLTDDDGERIFDEKTQSYRYIPMTGEALAAQEARAEAVRTGIALDLTEAGFQALMKTYNDDKQEEGVYPNGYYFTKDGDYRTYIEEIPAAAMTLSPGEVTEVRSEYGVHFIYALENDKGAYAAKENADFFEDFDETLRMKLYQEYIAACLPEVTVFRDTLDTVIYTEVPPNYALYW